MTTSLSLDLFRGDECFEADCEYEHQEAKVSGPPEDCYPEYEALIVVHVYNAGRELLQAFQVTESEHAGLLERAREAVRGAEEAADARREDAEEGRR